MIGRDGAAGLACLAGALVLLWASRDVPQPPLVPIGPAFYPRILFAVTAAVSAALVATEVLGGRREPLPAARHRLVLLTFALFTLYVGLLPLLGYRAATFLFVGALQVALEPPRGRAGWLRVLAVAAATVAVTYLVFERYLSVLLPRGRLTGF